MALFLINCLRVIEFFFFFFGKLRRIYLFILNIIIINGELYMLHDFFPPLALLFTRERKTKDAKLGKMKESNSHIIMNITRIAMFGANNSNFSN